MYTGIDIIEVKRIEKVFGTHKNFIRRVYTEDEVKYCQSKKNCFQHYAARFASKEAVLKAFGTGLRDRMKWTDIETLNEESGRPYVNLYGRARELAKEKNIGEITISLSHCKDYAIAHALLVPANSEYNKREE
ncbi:MAG: holo-ACP synthase [Candidatus Scalindua sediminis]|jgi:holo-[acyl-carrier protein] synthase|nr:holo-ACP synthase [Candidatus Scalindua sediminis]HDY69205.1 holo-[acyl-carrier-protein] synthase [Candidatus Scalindua sp.]